MTTSSDPGPAPTTAPKGRRTLQRWQVVQRLLRLFEDPAYLEIGVNEGETFHRVDAPRKVAVDPEFLFDWRAEQQARPGCGYYPVTSDAYFGSIADEDEKFDVIYLDGLHTFEQTLRDLLNSLDRLKPNGVILIDDVRPSSYHASLPDHLHSIEVRRHVKDTSKSWMGDVYRLLWFVDTFCQGLSYRTVANNHGQAVVWRQRRTEVTQRSVREVAELSFEDFVRQQDVLRREPMSKIARALRTNMGVGTDRAADT